MARTWTATATGSRVSRPGDAEVAGQADALFAMRALARASPASAAIIGRANQPRRGSERFCSRAASAAKALLAIGPASFFCAT